MYLKLLNTVLLLAIVLSAGQYSALVFAQAQIAQPAADTSLYLDPAGGMTADAAVALALENNGELQASRKEVEAARSLVKQAGLRANPKLNATGAKQIGGATTTKWPR